jgi:hypothetical protein
MARIRRDSEGFDTVDLPRARRLLWAWLGGEVEEGDLVDFADRHLPGTAVTDPADPDRPVYVVLDALSTIFGQPLNRRDAMALLRYLVLWEADPETAEDWLERYWDSIDWQERLEGTEETNVPAEFPSAGDDPLRALEE